MESNSEQKQVFVISPSDLRDIASRQQNKIHHLISKARGTAGMALTIVAILITSYSIFPNYFVSYQGIAPALNGMTGIMGSVYGLGLAGAQLIVAISVGTTALSSGFIGFLRLLDVALASTTSITKIPSPSVYDPDDTSLSSVPLNSVQYDSYLWEAVVETDNRINVLDNRYSAGVFRLLIGFALGFMTYQVYSWLLAGDISSILILNIFLILPVTISQFFLQKINIMPANPEEDQDEGLHPTLAEEVTYAEEDFSRFSAVKPRLYEKFLLAISTVCSAISIAFYIFYLVL